MIPCVPLPAAVAGILVAALATAWAHRAVTTYKHALKTLRDELKVHEAEKDSHTL